MLQRFIDDESGATAIEYGLIASLIAVAIVAALTGVGSAMSDKFQSVSSAVESSTGGGS